MRWFWAHPSSIVALKPYSRVSASSPVEILPIVNTIVFFNGRFMDTSVLRGDSPQTAKLHHVNTDKEEDQLCLCQVICLMKRSRFTEARVSVRCQGKNLLLVEAHPDIIEVRYSITSRVIMDILSGPLSTLTRAVILKKLSQYQIKS